MRPTTTLENGLTQLLGAGSIGYITANFVIAQSAFRNMAHDVCGIGTPEMVQAFDQYGALSSNEVMVTTYVSAGAFGALLAMGINNIANHVRTTYGTPSDKP